jgi:LysM repeat protein
MRCFVYLPFICVFIVSGMVQAQSVYKMSREDYISTYRDIAIKEMKRSGIPASITLAQGMLESDNGNSRLAIRANNHFGIKCHGWKGKKIYHDDDEKRECFRKYKNANESYIDHTDFLMNTPRYVSLFLLDQTDYKGWARGLKEYGYATSSTYAEALVRIIEENELYQYDESFKRRPDQLAEVDDEEFEVEVPHRKILTRNRINYIIVQEGDTYQELSEELDMLPFELAKYNELEKKSKLTPGEVLYIQPKRNRASVEFRYHTVEEGQTMYEISQMYGIKLHKLYQKNLMEVGTEPEPGDVLWLRKKKKEEEELPVEDQIEVEFEE